MTMFQIAALAFFGVVLAVNYRSQLVALVARLSKKAVVPAPVVPAPPPPSQPALNLVNDLLLINDLRERLDSVGCQEGVDACTILLRVMIEFDYQK